MEADRSPTSTDGEPLPDSVPGAASAGGAVHASALNPSGPVRSRLLRHAFLWVHFVLSVCVGHLYLSSPFVLLGVCVLIGLSDPHLAGVILASVGASTSLGHAFSYLAALVDPAFFEPYARPAGSGGTRRSVVRSSACGLALAVLIFAACLYALALLASVGRPGG